MNCMHVDKELCICNEYKSNWQLLEFDQKLLDQAIREMESLGIEPEKLKDIACWVNEQPYPYKLKD